MRITLQATDGGFLADEDAVGFSFGAVDADGAEHYLNLERQVEDCLEEDHGIRLEFDNQGYGDYGCLGACRLNRNRLSIDLCAPLAKLDEEVEGFDLLLATVSDNGYEELVRGLPRAFRGVEELLTIA